MTDRELGNELARIGAAKTPRRQEIVNEMKARGQQFLEATPPTSGVGISGDIPVRPGVSITGTVAQDPRTGHMITGGGIKLGKPGAPQFTGIAPRPDGLNAETNTTAKFGDAAELSERLTLNVAPDLTISGSYKAKGTVTMPDGRSFEVEVVIERRPDGTWNTKLPDGITTTTPLPGGGTIGTKLPGDQPSDPQLKGPKPNTPKQSGKRGLSFDLSGTITLDKEFTPNPAPPPAAEEVQRALRDYTRAQQEQRERTANWMTQNRQEALRRQAAESATQEAAAAEAARRAAMPDRDRDQIPDQQDATPNQNDTDPTSTDIGDGPEANPGYDRPNSSPVASPGVRPDNSHSSDVDTDRDGISNSNDATPNQNDTDPTSTDIGDGPEGNAGYGDPSTSGSTGPSAPSSSNTPGEARSDNSRSSDVDTDRDGISDTNDATPNQNDTDPASTDIGDGPEGNPGYGGPDSDPGSCLCS